MNESNERLAKIQAYFDAKEKELGDEQEVIILSRENNLRALKRQRRVFAEKSFKSGVETLLPEEFFPTEEKVLSPRKKGV